MFKLMQRNVLLCPVAACCRRYFGHRASGQQRQRREKKDQDKSSSSHRIKIESFGQTKGGRRSEIFNLGKDWSANEKKFIMKGKCDEIDPDELANVVEDPMNDDDLRLYARDKNEYHSKIVDEDTRNRRKMKLAIIKKKIDKLEGRDEQEMNLLTWDAKEQIKYLHIHYPDTWTPERISESYPITVQACRKLLRSKWVPKTLEDVAEHDRKVIENWKYLSKAENSEPSGPAINFYEEMIKSNKETFQDYLNRVKSKSLGSTDTNGNLQQHQLLSASGINRQQMLSDYYSAHESLLCKPDNFSKLVNKDDKIEKLFRSKKH